MRLLTILAISFASASFAESAISISDAYAFSANPNAKAGGAYFLVQNHSDDDITLLSVSSETAKRAELHTHIQMEDGSFRMTEVEGGILVPAKGCTVLKRGGFHVMLMGLTEGLEDGANVPLALSFDNGDVIALMPSVDRSRGGEYTPAGAENCYDATRYEENLAN